MSELLSSITGGGGGFIPKFGSATINIPSGQTGIFLTLTPPAGQKVRLTALGAGTIHTSLTTISVGGNAIVSDVKLESTGSNANGVNEFLIGWASPVSPLIEGDTDEVIELSTNVATSSSTLYTYQFGV